jgi:hypothetical protein
MFDGCNGSPDIEIPAAGCPGCCYILGAAALHGLIGMGEALRQCGGKLLPSWDCTNCNARNYDMRAVWCATCSPRRHAREIREAYPEDGSRGQYKESES